jgi:ribosomal protein S18 acetylase RimI-like enzyme
MTSSVLRVTRIALSPITLSDRPLFERAFRRLDEAISDSTFFTTFTWAEPLESSFAVIADHLCVFSAADGDLSMILPPMGLSDEANERLPECIQACFALMDEVNAAGPGIERSRIEYVSDEVLSRLRRHETHPLSASPMPGDYVYPREALVELAGGDLKSKRKLRSRFLREHPNVQTGSITASDIPECLDLLNKWQRVGDTRHEGETNDGLIGTDVLRRRDALATIRALETVEALGLDSMVLRSEGRIVGFTIGERLSSSMAVVYIEKTDPEVSGAAQFIYSEFCRINFLDVREINAGDDWGIPSLRFTKISYRPCRMLTKNTLTRQAVVDTGSVERCVVSKVSVMPSTRMLPVHAQSNPVFRLARRDDARVICDIEGKAFTGEHERFTLRQVQRLTINPRARVLIAELDGRVVGWTVTLIRTHRRWCSGRIYAVAVDPAYAGRGIGRAMVVQSLDELAKAGITRTYLEVRSDNEPAIALYRSLDFAVIRPLPGYYGSGSMGLRMRRVGTLPRPADQPTEGARTSD